MKREKRSYISALEGEWLDWYRLSPRQRWKETQKLWGFYIKMGGSLDPEPDSQSPFNSAFLRRALSAHGRPGLHIIRRSRV
jgi:hypothetical protein